MENKWWEYYAVRYFVGTVVGAVIVAFLNSAPHSPFKGSMTSIGELKEATFLGVGLFAALGFAFCYIASSPVLTLHTARAHMRVSTITSSKLSFFAALVIPVVIAIVAFWQFLPPIAAASSGLIVGIQFGLIFLSFFTNFSVIEKFYRDLATERAKVTPEKDKQPTPGSEYVTSYRHLREHGNAFMIVLLEGLLAYTLLHSPSRSWAAIVLAFWLLPAAATWLVGTVLESRLVSKPLP
ncbi:MAG: hypothetical protein B7Y56_08130 [Gallionellales bacterium 35-53-114]|jgi:hypothetical protein|nr:MAG: hypothetical protein B7Y56_08130 [Gallionellales bacterium 35-53-114]OYZ63264.1 MAG: hypothetical protein B7Y04_10310 [Gallionellales bacterium 24-53-125]OZB08726.1 MAG: hypothetical protein B7X61_09400 [Gallionellales bacterium 39-52-133]HQS57401.1 hypothetical protein [Gallionellaceae bacterium]HQS74411.1 hypothetical protein [Gallionellaceae bacterium]